MLRGYVSQLADAAAHWWLQTDAAEPVLRRAEELGMERPDGLQRDLRREIEAAIDDRIEEWRRKHE